MNFKYPILTTREQSERLLVLGVKSETADMCLAKNYGIEICVPYCDMNIYNQAYYRPAWSLVRLLEMMPTSIENDYCSAGLQVTPPIIQYWSFEKEENYAIFNRTDVFDNAISCIEWLIKNNYFNKEFLNDNGTEDRRNIQV